MSPSCLLAPWPLTLLPLFTVELTGKMYIQENWNNPMSDEENFRLGYYNHPMDQRNNEKHRENREKLPQEHLINCQGVKVFLLEDVTITTVTTATVTTVTISTVTI